MPLTFHIKKLGGTGSGNFGHSGRKGEVGGSSKEGDFGPHGPEYPIPLTQREKRSIRAKTVEIWKKDIISAGREYLGKANLPNLSQIQRGLKEAINEGGLIPLTTTDIRDVAKGVYATLKASQSSLQAEVDK